MTKFNKGTIVKLLVLALFIAAGIAVGLSQCKKTENIDIKPIIESKTVAYKTDLEDSLESFHSNQDILDYLISWAKTKSITYEKDKYGNLILSIPSTEEYKDAPPTVVVATYDYKNIKAQVPQLTTALFLAKNNQKTGDLSVIFTASDGGDFSGISNLSKKYFPENAKVFCLNDGMKQMWSFSSGAMSSYKFTGAVDRIEPTGATAFEISIDGLPGGTPDGRINSYPNPIKELSDMLAYFKTNAMIFQLAAFDGGDSANLYPTKAKMTIVVPDNYVEKFTSKLESTISSFNQNYKEDFKDAKMYYSQVSMPSSVLSEDAQNNFLSSMYTLLNGTYSKDNNNEADSITSLGYIALGDSVYTIGACAVSWSDDNLQKIDNDYQLAAGVSSLSYEKVASYPSFTGDPNSQFAQNITKAFKSYTTYDMEYKRVTECTNAGFIKDKSPNCSIVDVSYGPEKIERYSGTILTYMVSLPHKENTDA